MYRFILLLLLPALAQAAPVIDSFSPPAGTTSGGQVTITGSGLDDSDPPFGNDDEPSVTLNNLPLTIVGDPSPTQIVINLPAGQGSNLQVKVTLNDETGSSLYSYLPPNISNVTGTSATQGGGTLTITGNNFGLNGSVTVGGSAAGVTSWSHTGITAQAPAGQGTGLPVVVTAGGQSSAPFNGFSYALPQIVGTAAGPRPTAGGAPVTLNGNNFGTSATLIFDSVPVPVDSQTHNSISFTLPSGEGVAVPVAIDVAGQSSTVFEFDYDPPVITDIDPPTGAATAATEITLSGANFGLSPVVSFGSGSGTVISSDHEEIVFTRPPGEEGCLQVVVHAGGQSSAHTHFLSSALTSPPGYYIDVANSQILPAPVGRIAPSPNMTAATPTLPGFYAPIPGMSQALPASPGYYVPNPGAATQTPAPPGTFASLQGQSFPTPAAQGHYTPIQGMRMQLPADPGYYATGTQSTSQTAAQVGKYASGPAAEVAEPALPGSYAPIVGLRAPIPAPAGTYAPGTGLSDVVPIPPGFESGDGFSLSALPQVQVVGAQLLPNGDFELTFSTDATNTYGIFYTENLVDFVLVETAAGTGSDVQINVTPPNPGATRRFWVVASVQLPME